MRAGFSAAIAITIVAALLLTGLVVMPFFFENPRGFEADSLVPPEINLEPQVVPWSPGPGTATELDHSIHLSWVMTPVYAGYGGVLNLSVENQSPNLIYIYGFSVEWPDHSLESSRACSVNLTVGSVVNLGMIFFTAPDEPGRADYRINVDLAVRSPNGTTWHDYGKVPGKQWDADLLACAEPTNYDIISNPRNYYDKATSLMDRGAVTALAEQVRGIDPGGYNLQQILYSFDWVHNNIAYADDPTDIWQSARETMTLRSGDCEDHAILMASLISELGGTARFNLIEGHAFTTVFMGDSSTDIMAVAVAISTHYGTSVPLHFLQDGSGYWMTMDTVGFPYAGGLTANSAPVLNGTVNWTFIGTDILINVDAVF